MKIKVATACLNQTPLAWKSNESNIRKALKTAQGQNVQILCLPEMSTCGYGCQDLFFHQKVAKKSWQVLCDLLPHTKNIFTCIGLPIHWEGQIFNTVAVVCDGEVLGIVAKQFLANDGIHYEKRWFSEWQAGRIESYPAEIRGTLKSIPLGDLVFDISGVRLGFEICEDAWVKERVGFSLFQRKVQVILSPSASHYAMQKKVKKDKIVERGSQQFQCAYIFSNLLGNESGRAIFEGDGRIAQDGKILARCPRFSFHSQTFVAHDITVIQKPSAETKNCIFVDYAFTSTTQPTQAAPLPRWESSKDIDQEEISRAVALGLFDYMRKSYSCGVVISLSGGVDSASTLLFSYLMVGLAWEELGSESFTQKLNYIKESENLKTLKEWLNYLITTAYQATKNNSTNTLTCAEELAHDLNVSFLSLNLDKVIAQYQDLISEPMGLQWDWKTHNISLQNVQARARVPSIWLIANLKNALLLCTSNRSEASVGYSTMDGDSAGGLAPIAGLSKSFLQKWLSWLTTDAHDFGIPKTAIQKILDLPPSAELKPLSENQTDESELMPYAMLTEIEKLFLTEHKSPQECIEILENQYPEYALKDLEVYVNRFFSLWYRSQWKRERTAISFHLDEYSVDPKSWCRFPILSDGETF